MVLNGKVGLECEGHVDGIRLEHVSEFKYLVCVLDESSSDGADFRIHLRSFVKGHRTITTKYLCVIKILSGNGTNIYDIIKYL